MCLFLGLLLVVVGLVVDGCVMLVVLCVGVKDFVDVDGVLVEVVCVVCCLLVECVLVELICCGCVLVVLGVCFGVGVIMLVINLVMFVCCMLVSDVMLFDLGQLLCDGVLYLNVQVNFYFVEVVCNLCCFDQVFVQIVLLCYLNGFVVLLLLILLVEMCDILFFEVFGLFNWLCMFFDLQVVDLGGFGNIDFIV